MRNWTFGAKALSIRPPATMTPLKMVTGRAPKLSTQALQTGLAMSPTPETKEPTHAVMPFPSWKVWSHSGYRTPTDWGEP